MISLDSLPDPVGFIREKTDIKILILYVLNKLPSPIDRNRLAELVLFDSGFGWFEYTQCLAELGSTGLLGCEDGMYEITEEGRNNVACIGSSLPFSVRARADRLTAPVAAHMRRSRMIETYTEIVPDSGPIVTLRLSDGIGEVISLRVSVPDEETAAAIEKRFEKKAEDIANGILSLLTEED